MIVQMIQKKHIEKVKNYIIYIVNELLDRGNKHDKDKIQILWKLLNIRC